MHGIVVIICRDLLERLKKLAVLEQHRKNEYEIIDYFHNILFLHQHNITWPIF